eukprot:5272527-Amphidinium_carterae.1
MMYCQHRKKQHIDTFSDCRVVSFARCALQVGWEGRALKWSAATDGIPLNRRKQKGTHELELRQRNSRSVGFVRLHEVSLLGAAWLFRHGDKRAEACVARILTMQSINTVRLESFAKETLNLDKRVNMCDC